MDATGIELKLRRAAEHLAAIREIAAEATSPSGYVLERTLNDTRTEFRVRIVGLSPVPPELSAIIGDYVHNARSALEHLATELVLGNGGRPSNRTQFPVCLERPAHGVGVRTKSGGVDPRALEIIESRQPYIWEEGRYSHPLYELHHLWNVDKHQTLLTARFGMVSASWSAPPGASGTVTEPTRQVEIIDGMELLRLYFDQPMPSDFGSDLTVDLVLRLRQPAGTFMPSGMLRADLAERLDSTHHYVEDTVRRLTAI